MPTKKKTTKKTATKRGTKGSKGKKLNLKEELFCQLYAGGKVPELFGNATQCYMHAYKKHDDIDKIDKQIDKVRSDGKLGYEKEVHRLESKKKSVYNVSRTNAWRLLTNADISSRCDELMDQHINDHVVDRELQYVITQRKDLSSKVRAVDQYNKVRNRLQPDKHIHLEAGDLRNLSDEELQEEIDKMEKFFTKED